MEIHEEPDRLSLAFGALADPTRRAILARLAKGDADVSELMQPFSLSQPTISNTSPFLNARAWWCVAAMRNAALAPLSPHRSKKSPTGWILSADSGTKGSPV